MSGRDDRNGSNGHFWPRGRFRAIQTPLPAVLMQSLSTCRRSTLPGPLPPVEVVRRTARARQKGQILAKSRELTGDQFNVTLCNLQWQGSKESSRDASGTPWIAPIRRNDDEPCPSALLIGSAWFEPRPNGSKSTQILHFESLLGCFEADTLATSSMVMNYRSRLRRHGLLGPRCAPKCRFGWTLK